MARGLFGRHNATNVSHDGTHDCAKNAYLTAIETIYEVSPDEPGALRTRDRRCGKCGRILETLVL